MSAQLLNWESQSPHPSGWGQGLHHLLLRPHCKSKEVVRTHRAQQAERLAPPECSAIVYYYYLLLSGPIRAPQLISHQRGWVSTPFLVFSPTQHRLCWDQLMGCIAGPTKCFISLIEVFNLGDFIYNTRTSGLWSLRKDPHPSWLKQRGSGPLLDKTSVLRLATDSLLPVAHIQEAPPTYRISLPL